MLTPLNNPELCLNPSQKLVWLWLTTREDRYFAAWEVEVTLGLPKQGSEFAMDALEQKGLVAVDDPLLRLPQRKWKLKQL
jgi:hypothetical protein